MIVFLAQITIIFIVIGASIVNLSLFNSNNKLLWVSLLSSCLGYLLPNPTLEKKLQHYTPLANNGNNGTGISNGTSTERRK